MSENVMLAHTFNPSKHNVKGWWMSEKLDGVRAIWTGEELVSRNLKPIYASPFFTADLPRGVKIDGELWIDRGKFQETVSVVRKQYPIESEWEKVKYRIFDFMEEGHYSRRMECAKELPDYPHLEIVPYRNCYDLDELDRFYTNILLNGGEGVILRNPNTPYEYRRTRNLLKYKPIFNSEAELVNFQEGTGKYTNMIGALVCKDDTGRLVIIGSGLTDEMRDLDNPTFGVGSIIKFKYYGLTNAGEYRHPVLPGTRED